MKTDQAYQTKIAEANKVVHKHTAILVWYA